MQLLNLILAGIAFRTFLAFDPAADIAREVEKLFFVAEETPPLVVVLLAAWLIYRRRGSLFRMVGRATARGTALASFAVAIAVFAWSAYTGGTHLLAISLAALMLGTGALFAGIPGLRAVSLPAALLVFAIPLPGAVLNHTLWNFQLWTAQWAGSILAAVGYPAFVSGDQIMLAGQGFAVIEGCSGLRSVMTLTMTSILLADLFGRRGLHAVLVVVAAPFIAFVLNGFRVITLMLNPHSEIVAIHNLQGVLILLLGLMLLYGLDGLLARWLSPKAATAPAEPAAAASAEGAGAWGYVFTGVLLTLVALSFGVGAYQPEIPLTKPPALRAEIPLEVDEGPGDAVEAASGQGVRWQGRPAEYEFGFLESVLYREILVRTYQRIDTAEQAERKPRRRKPKAVGPEVDLSLVVAPNAQRFRSALSPKLMRPGSGWQIEGERRARTRRRAPARRVAAGAQGIEARARQRVERGRAVDRRAVGKRAVRAGRQPVAGPRRDAPRPALDGSRVAEPRRARARAAAARPFLRRDLE